MLYFFIAMLAFSNYTVDFSKHHTALTSVTKLPIKHDCNLTNGNDFVPTQGSLQIWSITITVG